jgi:hypothetical protein
MKYSEVLMKDVERFRAWLKKRYPNLSETERERLLHHLVEIRSFIHMIRYGKRPDAREYIQ